MIGTEHHRKQARKSHAWANVKSAGMKWPAEIVSPATSPTHQEDSFETVSVCSPDGAQRMLVTEDLPLSLGRDLSSLKKHIEHTGLPLSVSKVTYPRGDTFYERCKTLNIN